MCLFLFSLGVVFLLFGLNISCFYSELICTAFCALGQFILFHLNECCSFVRNVLSLSLALQANEMPKLTEQLAGPLRQMQVTDIQSELHAPTHLVCLCSPGVYLTCLHS